MAIIPPIPPAFPVPVLPQAFDTSLSYYELLAKLTETINTISVQVNQNTANIAALSGSISQIQSAITEIQTEIGNLPAEFQQLSADLAAETQARIDGDGSLAGDIASFKNIVFTNYVTFTDLDNDYLVNGITFELLTQAEFDALEAAGQLVAKRVYFIDTGANIVIRYHYANGETPVMNAQATGLFSFAFGNRGQNITGVFTPDE